MTKGVKFLLIGCVAVIFLAIVAGGMGTYFVGKWFKKKGETVGNILGTEESEVGKRLTELKKEYPFTPRPDNLITEKQLVRFLAARKQVYQVWKKHEAEFKELAKNQDSNISAPLKSLEILNEARLAHTRALEDQEMGPDEYRYLAQMVYITWMTSTAKEMLKDKSLTETSKELLTRQIESLDKQIQDPNTHPEVKKQLESVRDQAQKQLAGIDTNPELQRADEALNSIPQQNIDLFKKHEQEIRQYSMAGLEMSGIF